MKHTRRILLGTVALTLAAGISAAQLGRGGGRGRGMSGEFLAGNEPMRPLPADRNGVPKWDVDPQFKGDVFTFVRLRYTTASGASLGGYFGSGFGYRAGTGTSWLNDWPDADLDLSFRLQQMTSLKVNPEPIQLQITDDRLFDYPFAYMLQVGRLEFTEQEVAVLQRYLLNGGFLMVDDHWGPDQAHWKEQIKRVFPDREQVELPVEHPIFHCVFDLKAIPQVPPIQLWMQYVRNGDPERSWRYADDPDPHYRAIFDDHGRMMVLECGNTDLGDSWEREGINEQYFHIFAESRGYPMAINIIFYAMTH